MRPAWLHVVAFACGVYGARLRSMGSALMVVASEKAPSDQPGRAKAPAAINLFEPTNEWKTIEEGQQLPGGLWIRINLATGLKEARLLE
ncbi:hypothetical protein SDRG_14215 [Saprolegnia diclina VS20]|uniref:Uncharacterized protein n=1 Tax=Saprolegnia diclina (strain VS20) TaxID=1156394 RepID=T0Q0A4_SAPDV|nr:hypothetical protein SDRG_14215 [Saprolegnia diclina VS20]EQC27936.1 hypothetical protein SDRG_14215 [Saprolegnia diclina VS20]|eukprot:XP_008618549.1 hypothetical protein SDRG_14215 [Saprolegnia diclina VS20]